MTRTKVGPRTPEGQWRVDLIAHLYARERQVDIGALLGISAQRVQQILAAEGIVSPYGGDRGGIVRGRPRRRRPPG